MDDDDSDCKGKNEGNEIYQSLEEMNISELSEKNKQISSFLMDIIINIIQEHNDPIWIININNTSGELQRKIAQQKEREKQVLISQFDSMDDEQRNVYTMKQSIGAVNWFQDLTKKNQEFTNSLEFEGLTEAEREEKFKEFLEETIESKEMDELNTGQETNVLPNIEEEEEEGYDYNEEEGLEPEDIDGDDEENDIIYEVISFNITYIFLYNVFIKKYRTLSRTY